MNFLELSHQSSPDSLPFAPQSTTSMHNLVPEEFLVKDIGANSNSDQLGQSFWYSLDPTKIFNAGYNYNDYNNGACNGHWKDARFMREPYIHKTGSSISAQVTGEAVNRKACIYQHSQHQCDFFIGSNGVQQLEFDYEIVNTDAAQRSNWFSFWINSADQNGRWVKDAEVDSIENMWKSFAHNFAGLGHQVEIPVNRRLKGHATTWLRDSGAEIDNCDFWTSTCPKSSRHAWHNFGSRTTQDIRAGRIKHHLTIDYWMSAQPSKLTVHNIRVLASGSFEKMCPSAKRL